MNICIMDNKCHSARVKFSYRYCRMAGDTAIYDACVHGAFEQWNDGYSQGSKGRQRRYQACSKS